MTTHYEFSPEANDVPACIGKRDGARRRPAQDERITGDTSKVTCHVCMTLIAADEAAAAVAAIEAASAALRAADTKRARILNHPRWSSNLP